jgi:hypothetical protein
VSSFATYPISSVRDEVQKTPVKPPTITPKYDSNATSTVLEWHVSFFLIKNNVNFFIEKTFFWFLSRAKKIFE